MRNGLILIVLALLIACTSCQVENAPDAGGCRRDTDCQGERVCVDRICRFPEEAETVERAEVVVRRIFDALVADQERYYMGAWPLSGDLTWGFDLVNEDDTNPEAGVEEIVTTRENNLAGDFTEARRRRDWDGAEFVRFDPGLYKPIAQGEQRAIRDLERLSESTLVYKRNGVEKSFGIKELIRLRGRWKLFDLLD